MYWEAIGNQTLGFEKSHLLLRILHKLFRVVNKILINYLLVVIYVNCG